VFGMMEALLSFFRRQVGLRTDAADATGSLHAKTSSMVAKPIIANGSAVKSVQRGTIAYTPNATVSATISAVDTSKAIAIFNSFFSFSKSTTIHYEVYGFLANSTTVTIKADGNDNAGTAAYVVIEFY